ncbi:Hypothetical protein R9X50_00570500 [Acrodontium crateriforme]|uniref:Brl1/Brr6 domain-containing protein n=1 Tax=Acrodontium crateriforme TaxID=150365 RepID=A0AAQ3MCU4_9PEZI|nr:Hypothetical protein R9X50_00570500 [Acrodontium crateriforme]
MSRYNTQGSPMEFEFQNGTGPLDSRSPFSQLSQNTQRFPPQPSTAQKRKPHSGSTIFPASTLTVDHVIGSYSVFDSPSKLRTSQQSSPSKPLPPVPTSAFNSLFTTPRKSTVDFDDSSAGETPRSPEQNNDSDATPDTMNLRTAVSRLNTAMKTTMTSVAEPRPCSPLKEKPAPVRRESWVMRFKSKMASPGRGEMQSHALEKKRAEKRRRRDGRGMRKRRHSMTDSEVDDIRISPRKTSGRQVPRLDGKPHWISSFFTFLGQHPTVPHILSFYAQLLFNVFLLGFCAYLIYGFYAAIRGDIDKESHDAMMVIMAEVAVCARDYRDNKCDPPENRLPALELACGEWHNCMNQDPKRVGRARMSAQAFAKIFNSFIDPISYKAMAFTCMMVVGAFIVSNSAFVFFRNKAVNGPYPYYDQGAPPPTPQRTFSGQDGGFYGTPWQNPPINFEPQPSGGYGQIDGRKSPVRRLAYD